MTGIIAAMQKELSELEKHIENASYRQLPGTSFISGTLYGHEIVAAVCGIGKVNAAVCAQRMIDLYRADRIINTGVAGALSGSLHVCDAVVASYAVQHDVDTTALGDEIGFVSTVNTVRFETDKETNEALLRSIRAVGLRGMSGGIASGDQFISAAQDKQRISSLFGCVACEMEGGAIAQVCRINQIPCAIIRTISDGADEDASMSYAAFSDLAAVNSAKALLHFFKNN